VHIAVDVASREPQAVSYAFAQDRASVKRRAVTTALALLRRTLLS
jgi:nicotinamide mononucleotide (NMN) deamidase PncC